MAKAIVTVETAENTNTATLASNAYASGDKLAKATTTAIESTFAIFASKAVSIEVAEDITDLFYDFMVSNLDEKTLTRVGTKTDKDGNETYTFRSHPATKCVWQYQTVITKAVSRGASWSDIFEMDDNKHKGTFRLPSKKQVEELLKDSKSNLEKLKALCKTADTILQSMGKGSDTKADKAVAQGLVADLFNTASQLS